jgi:hypothetical protein
MLRRQWGSTCKGLPDLVNQAVVPSCEGRFYSDGCVSGGKMYPEVCKKYGEYVYGTTATF